MKVFVIAGINMSLTNLRTARLCRPEKPGSVVHKIDSLAQSLYPLLFISYSFVIYLFLSYIVYLSLVSGNLGIAPPYLVNLAFLPIWAFVIVNDNHVTLLLDVRCI